MIVDRELELWNNTKRDYPLNLSLVNLLEVQASTTPDAIAIYFEGLRVSYAELTGRANKLARYLRAQGVGRDTLVGVYMERSIEMVVALVGILKAGAAFVPFDPEYPLDRLNYMLEDSQVRVVLTQQSLDRQALPDSLESVYLDEPSWANIDDEDKINLDECAEPTSAAYMIYTSGSTGKPKGVVNEHRGLVNRLLWMQETFNLTGNDRVLQKTPYSFDVSVWEFFWPLMTGASIVIARPGGHRDTEYLIDTIVQKSITTMHFVPSMLSLFLSSNSLHRITSLRQVMCSGEALPFGLTKRFFDLLPSSELHNLYGPTEAAIDVTHWPCSPPQEDKKIVPIGKPIANIQTYILNESLQPVALGEEGELHLAGVGVARGYWNKPELTEEKFISNPFSNEANTRMYKTGDLARYLSDGNIEYRGRIDNQVKIRGYRIELGEIESALLKLTGIAESVVVASENSLEDRELVAYLVANRKGDGRELNVSDLRAGLLKNLPNYMVPARFIYLQAMPLTPNGKLDRRTLVTTHFERPELSQMYIAPRTTMEMTLADIWAEILSLNKVGIKDNFFEIGGNSLNAVRLASAIQNTIKKIVPVVKIFEFSCIDRLAAYLEGVVNTTAADMYRERAPRARDAKISASTDGVAVIGMVGRFPGAPTVEVLWQNLVNGVESISHFAPDELDPWVEDEIRKDPNYVPFRGILADADKFDNKFFGIGPLEAKVMDPQQRVFLELAWSALEKVGYTAEDFKGMIGVYAGIGDNHYYTRNVRGHKDLIKTVGNLVVGYGNEKDYIATRVSFALNLTGPSVSANTGCSTSLLAIDMAYKALEDGECDMALAGGVDIHVPQKTGQIYQQGGTFTIDGHCRPFDAEATGTMFCDGAGIVVLKRLANAIADGDKIYSVILGIAKNNDGSNKVSFLAPSVEGQTQVITLAQAQANVTADTISYVEAHGTGTPLGDPIEIEALTKAFRITSDKKQHCYIGSIKGNVGHPTIASGVAGFIKASLALHHEKIPATLHFKKANPRIDFENSPFKVVSSLTTWPRTKTPRRAGVSSFGFGGTNVHGVLEEAPLQQPSGPSREEKLLVFSAKSEPALGRMLDQFACFAEDEKFDLADAAYTLQIGRKHFEYRRSLVCADIEMVKAAIQENKAIPVTRLTTLQPHVTFMFPGQGSQYTNMGRDLYQSSAIFRENVDRCCDLLAPIMERDLRELLFPLAGDEESATVSLKDTYYTQPALFTIEYSLAQLWMSMGVQPQAFVGHSVGEFVGACLAGVFSLKEALPLISLRAKLVRGLPSGSMLSVRCSAEEILDKLNDDVQLAAANSPKLCVVAGPTEAILRFAEAIEKEGLVTRHLHTSHAFHSAMMDPVVGDFVAAVSKIKLSAPSMPLMSSCSGDWMTPEQATSPEYWGQHLRSPVMFSNAISSLMASVSGVFLEVGPRDVLTTLARQQAKGDRRGAIIPSLANSGKDKNKNEWQDILSAMGALWQNGTNIDWKAYYAGERRLRIPLPTYPFEPSSHWLKPPQFVAHQTEESVRELESETAAKVTKQAPDGRDSVMNAIVQIISETVGIELQRSEETTPFIMLGADSLVLMQMSRLVKDRLGLDANFRQLLDTYTTPEILADTVRNRKVNSVIDDSVAVSSAEIPESKTKRNAELNAGLNAEELRHVVLGRDEHNCLAWFVSDESTELIRQIRTS